MFVWAWGDIVFHVGYPKYFCKLKSWGLIKFRFHPLAKEERSDASESKEGEKKNHLLWNEKGKWEQIENEEGKHNE